MHVSGRWLVALLVAVAVFPAATPVTGPAAAGPGSGASPPPDPDSDVLGWEAGYWHNESVAVTTDDGLNETELEALTARAMARVEVIRGLEFTEPVPVEVVPRANLTTGAPSFWADTPARTEGVWEALWILGEDTNATREIATHYDEGALGYYHYGRDEILLISDENGDGTTAAGVSELTLIHELVHALQDQHFDLSAPRYDRPTVDGYLAANALVEGEAVVVSREAEARCGEAWDCVEGSPGGVTSADLSMKLTLFFPYGDGPAYVHALRERGGWAAVNAAHRDPPASTSAVIHPNGSIEDTGTGAVPLDDRARDPWQPVPGGQTSVGEAGLYMLFWAQSHTANAGVVATEKLFRFDQPVDRWAYEANVSVGWRGDTVAVYRHAESGELGYVWRVRFANAAEAREFLAGYEAVLAAHDARTVDSTSTGTPTPPGSVGTWVVENGSFADAYRLARTDGTVTIVNAPTVDALAAIRPSRSPTPSPIQTTYGHTPTLTPTPTQTVTARPGTPTTGPPTGTVPPGTAVGIGDALVGALIGLVLLVGWWVLRRR